MCSNKRESSLAKDRTWKRMHINKYKYTAIWSSGRVRRNEDIIHPDMCSGTHIAGESPTTYCGVAVLKGTPVLRCTRIPTRDVPT